MQKQVQYIIKGMNRDMSISKYPSDHSYENKNIRITQREDETLLSITNEKGPSEVVLTQTIEGTIVGHCAIREYLVLFVKGLGTEMGQSAPGNPYDAPAIVYHNSIYRITPKTGLTVCLCESTDWDYQDETKEIFHTGLFFGDNIQTLGVYESDSVIKVYWVDNKNQNRFINIVNPKYTWNGTNDRYKPNELNFVPLQNFSETVSIERSDSSNGVFAPGTIQYMCTYYNMYGQESAFFYYSDLFYTAHTDRGGTEEETVTNSFKIHISNVDTQFEYIRIYSILRTSLNATPQCRIVADIRTKDIVDAEIIDTGTIGESFDYNALLFMCGDTYASRTMASKDDTLFNGNLSLLVPKIPEDIKAYFRNAVGSSISINFEDKDDTYYLGDLKGSYPYSIHLNLNRKTITTFKYGETYRFGIQFLHKTGKWSDVVYLGDFVNNHRIASTLDSFTDYIHLTRAKITINLNSSFDNYRRWFKDNAFLKMRVVIVYPRLCDRTILAQGIVCPTVYNVEDRKNNRPFAYSSWYSRPNCGTSANASTLTLGDSKGTYNEFKHNTSLPKNTKINSEIQCITEEVSPWLLNSGDGASTESRDIWVQNNRENFLVDKSIVTFHSPELEMSDDLDTLDLSNVDFRIVGIAPMTGFDSDIYLSTSTIGNLTLNSNFRKTDNDADDSTGGPIFGPGFYDEKTRVPNFSPDGWRCRMGNINWIDEETHYKLKHGNDGHNNPKFPKWYGFFIYPWHRSKSLNNTVSPDENGYESALLENKVITNARYSYNNYYFNDYVWEPDEGVSGIKLANIEPQSEESEVSLIKLPKPENSSLEELNYYGSVDKIVVAANSDDKSVGYPIVISASSRLTSDGNESGISEIGARAKSYHELFKGTYDNNYTDAKEGTLIEYLPYGFVDKEQNNHSHDTSTWNDYVHPSDNSNSRRAYWQVSTFDPVRLRYKSTKHAVMAFNYTSSHKQVILPRFSSEPDEAISRNNAKLFWEIGNQYYSSEPEQHAFTSEEVGGTSSSFGYLFIGELYRKNVQSRFGGQSEEALEKNVWLPAGESIDIPSTSGIVEMYAEEGDTYYQRYDCIKTFPFTPDEKNSLIETVSFMCETRINIDGRYDKNRGNATKFTITPKNFNLMNPVYNQTNNFFNYQYYNSNRIYPDHFNQITWSQTKSSMSEIDTWTKLNLGSLMDMDGDKGEIVALVNFGNEIWCFQERGVSKILFNNRVQIPVSDGVPIEITNGMKVQGKIYLTEKAGCQNKFAMAVTTHGVYFIDGYNSDICVFDGKSIQSLSDAKGFKQWISAQDGVTEWKRSTYATKVDGFRIEYDTEHKDVYFINDDYCLVFSEILGEFTSFMDYNKVRGMGNVKDEFYSLTDFDGEIKVWKMFGGDYNVFFKPDDEEDWTSYYKPFYVQYNVNPDPTMDKTFDNVEFRSDSWFGDVLLTALDSAGGTKTFDTLEAENEYQYGALSLNFARAQYSQDSTLKRKFRVWRTIMPREVGTRNRIRNTWCKVKLAWNNPNRYKTVLHDVIIRYFE